MPLLLPLLLLLLAPPVTPACPTCVFPTFSWDTIPAFVHCSQKDSATPRGGFGPEAIATLAKFPMVTIEKWQGSGVTPAIFEEEAWVTAATQIKRANPNITVVVWLDSFRIYTADKNLNPDLKKVRTVPRERRREGTCHACSRRDRREMPAVDTIHTVRVHR